MVLKVLYPSFIITPLLPVFSFTFFLLKMNTNSGNRLNTREGGYSSGKGLAPLHGHLSSHGVHLRHLLCHGNPSLSFYTISSLLLTLYSCVSALGGFLPFVRCGSRGRLYRQC